MRLFLFSKMGDFGNNSIEQPIVRKIIRFKVTEYNFQALILPFQPYLFFFFPESSNLVTDKCYHENLDFLHSMSSACCYHGNASRIKQVKGDSFSFMQSSLIIFL